MSSNKAYGHTIINAITSPNRNRIFKSKQDNKSAIDDVLKMRIEYESALQKYKEENKHLHSKLKEISASTSVVSSIHSKSALDEKETVDKLYNIKYPAKEATHLKFLISEKTKQIETLKLQLEEKNLENTSLEERLVQKEIYINNLLQKIIQYKHNTAKDDNVEKYTYEPPIDFVKRKVQIIETLYKEMRTCGSRLQNSLKSIRQELLFMCKRGILSASIDDITNVCDIYNKNVKLIEENCAECFNFILDRMNNE